MGGKAHSERLEALSRNKAGGMVVFSYFDLAAAVGSDTRRTMAIVGVWERRGLVERLGKGPKNRLQFRVTPAGQHAFAVQGKPSEQSPERNMWTAMRQLGIFTPQDIAINARTETVAITLEQARAFCQFLLRGDEPYLRVKQKAIPNRREAAYQLIRNTGPMPPRACRVRATYDDNLGAFTHLPEPVS